VSEWGDTGVTLGAVFRGTVGRECGGSGEGDRIWPTLPLWVTRRVTRVTEWGDTVALGAVPIGTVGRDVKALGKLTEDYLGLLFGCGPEGSFG
jgi:hypothetical protein